MAIINIKLKHCLALLMILVSACSTNPGRYQQKHDSTPTRLPSASELHDATPRAEQYSRGGNKNYQVRGKHYQVLKTADNFSQTGIASWYGRKFHGHLTSNGEIYDMYAMSAAHKNLPLPTYLKVVNNSNGRTVIVRVNDRGPFHQSRIIDLSYSAAYKLDMLKTGTAHVTITAITDFKAKNFVQQQTENTRLAPTDVNMTPVAKPTMQASSNTDALAIDLPSGQYIQVFASKSALQANKLAKSLSDLYQKNSQLEEKNGIFRVLVGPIQRSDEIAKLLLTIKANGHPNAFIRQ